MKKDKMKNGTGKVSSIGGQALMEGVMMRGTTSMAMAVRSPDGDILIETKRLKKRGKVSKIPVLRGLVAFFASLVSGVETLLKSAEVSSPEEETPSKGFMGLAVVLGVALGVGLFILLPSFLTSLLFDKILHYDNILLTSLTEGVLRIVIFVLYLFLVSRMKDIRRTFMYHGAEHRTINCYEHELDMTVGNVQKCSTRHNRCGTTFLFFVMIISILLFSLVNYIFSLAGLTSENFTSTQLMLIRIAARLALLPLVAGLSYELLRFLAKLPDNKFVAVLRAPGLALQRLTTYPPTDDMAEVALRSFLAVQAMDTDASVKEVKFGEVPAAAAREKIDAALINTNADSSEADWILCDVLKLKRNALKDVKTLSLKQMNALNKILERRKKNEPLWYILGYTDFYKERISIDNRALIPRPETELLAEYAIEKIKERGAEVLDLCTGSGCIALALAKNTRARITASDISDKALELAEKNLKGAVRLIKSDMFENLSGENFDLIVSNPPYIKTEVIASLDTEVKDYEPVSALDGGDDGLKFYRIIAEKASAHLKDGGCVILETGFDQAEKVKDLLAAAGFINIEIFKDYGGHDRIVFAQKGTK